jgi:hypothetical protein
MRVALERLFAGLKKRFEDCVLLGWGLGIRAIDGIVVDREE